MKVADEILTPSGIDYTTFQKKHPKKQVPKGHFQEFKAGLVGYMCGFSCLTCIDMKEDLGRASALPTGDAAAGPTPNLVPISNSPAPTAVQSSSSSSSYSTAIVPLETGLVPENLGPHSAIHIVYCCKYMSGRCSSNRNIFQHIDTNFR